ncbi:MAG: HAD-IA family hydrolase [Cyclobacteriaceae bacterium]|nr:HAD-IA family hydrolase [Cyclobacteriaceae bacterium]
MIKHILFDCDGVLVDTEYTAAQVMVEAMKNRGVNIEFDYFLHHFSGATFSAILDTYFGNSFQGDEKDEFINKLEQKIVAKVDAIKGVKEMLQSISIPMSIVSNSAIWQVKEEIEQTEISQYFTGHIFSSELVINPKPKPDVYNLAVKELGLKKKELLVVEDSITGATAALEAGLQVIGFAGASHILPGHKEKLLTLGVSEVADTMVELQEIIAEVAPS